MKLRPMTRACASPSGFACSAYRIERRPRSTRPCPKRLSKSKNPVGKSMPGGAAGGREMERAPFRPAMLDLPGDRDQRRGDIGGGGGTAALVRDNPQDRPLGPEPQHGFHKICAVGPVPPGGAQDNVARCRCPHGPLAGLL